MKVNVSNIKLEVNKLNKLIDEYEHNYLNLYNEVGKVSSYWQDGNSINFFNEVDKYKLMVKTNLDEVKELYNVYQYLIEKYTEFGEKISFDIEKQSSTLRAFDSYMNQINNIINSYKKLDLSFCSYYERETLMQQMSDLKKYNNLLFQIKENFNNTLEKIKEIEKTVNSKISKLSIEFITENDFSEYI